jgi:hypothetical protein
MEALHLCMDFRTQTSNNDGAVFIYCICRLKVENEIMLMISTKKGTQAMLKLNKRELHRLRFLDKDVIKKVCEALSQRRETMDQKEFREYRRQVVSEMSIQPHYAVLFGPIRQNDRPNYTWNGAPKNTCGHKHRTVSGVARCFCRHEMEKNATAVMVCNQSLVGTLGA